MADKEKKIMKRSKNLLILLAVLVLLVLAYIVMMQFVKDTEDDDNGKEIYYEATDVVRENITSIAVGEDGLSFSAAGDDWVYDKDADLPIDSSAVALMADTVANLTGTYRLTDVSDEALEEYGLTSPSLTVKVTEGSKEKVFYFGNYNSSVSAYYFCSHDAKRLVFLVSSDAYSAFDCELSDLIVKEEAAVIDADMITSVSLRQSDGSEVIYSAEQVDSGEKDEDGGIIYEHKAYITEGGVTLDCSYADFYELACDIGELEFSHLAGYTEADSSNFGFDAPSVLTVRYTVREETEADGSSGGYLEHTEEYTLVLGSADEDGYYFCKTGEDSKLIYKLSPALKAFFEKFA